MRQDKEGCTELAEYAESSTQHVFRALLGQEKHEREALNGKLAAFSS